GGDVLLGGEESGGISIQGHLPEGDGVLMALLLVEMVAVMEAPLEDLVEDLLREAGPSHYRAVTLRRAPPVSKTRMVERLTHAAPAAIGGVNVPQVNTLDGVKYTLADESWLLLRTSGTGAGMRVHAHGVRP